MPDRTHRRARRRTLTLLAISAATLPTGCRSPLFRSEEDYDQRVPVSRLREVDPLRIDRFATEDGLPAAEGLDADRELGLAQQRIEATRDEIEQREEVTLGIEQIRAAAIQNNLDLRVTLVDPLLDRERVSEEEGRFDALIFANAQIFSRDQAVVLATQSGQSNGWFFTPGLRVPLRTGGDLTIQNTLNRVSQDNPFLVVNPAKRSDLEVSLSQPLLRNAGRRANTAQIRIADLNRQATEAATKLQVITTLADTERAYWSLYGSLRALEVRLGQYDAAAEQLEQARRQFDAGRVAEIEVIRAASGLADRVDQIIAAERDALLAQRELKRLVNIPGLEVGTETFIQPQTPPDPVRFDLDGPSLAQQAMNKRMELLELELRIAADEATEALRRNEALPLITATLTHRINSVGTTFDDAVDTQVENRFTDWEVGLNAEVPIGNNERQARLAQAVLTRLRRLSTREARALTIRQEVLDIVDRLDAGWQRLLATRQAVALNARTLEAEQRQFRVGRSTTVDVLIADANLADARLAEIQALVDYQINQIDLAVATGTLLGASKVDWEPIDPRDWTPENARRLRPYIPELGDASPADSPATGPAAPPRPDGPAPDPDADPVGEPVARAEGRRDEQGR